VVQPLGVAALEAPGEGEAVGAEEDVEAVAGGFEVVADDPDAPPQATTSKAAAARATQPRMSRTSRKARNLRDGAGV
jgi:hypothetical protein